MQVLNNSSNNNMNPICSTPSILNSTNNLFSTSNQELQQQQQSQNNNSSRRICQSTASTPDVGAEPPPWQQAGVTMFTPRTLYGTMRARLRLPEHLRSRMHPSSSATAATVGSSDDNNNGGETSTTRTTSRRGFFNMNPLASAERYLLKLLENRLSDETWKQRHAHLLKFQDFCERHGFNFLDPAQADAAAMLCHAVRHLPQIPLRVRNVINALPASDNSVHLLPRSSSTVEAFLAATVPGLSMHSIKRGAINYLTNNHMKPKGACLEGSLISIISKHKLGQTGEYMASTTLRYLGDDFSARADAAHTEKATAAIPWNW